MARNRIIFQTAKDPQTCSVWRVYSNGDIFRPRDGYSIPAKNLTDKRGEDFYSWPLHMSDKVLDHELFFSAWLLALTVAKAKVDWAKVQASLDKVRNDPENSPEFRKILDEEYAKVGRPLGPDTKSRIYSPFDLMDAHKAARERAGLNNPTTKG